MNGLTASRWFDFGDRPVLMQDGARRFRTEAGVVQWQNGSFPSCIRGFDSLHPLHSFSPSDRAHLPISGSQSSKIPTYLGRLVARCPCCLIGGTVGTVEQRLGLRTRAVVLNLFEVCE